MEVVFTAGVTRRAKSPIPIESLLPTNQHQAFYRLDALPVTQSATSKHWRKISSLNNCINISIVKIINVSSISNVTFIRFYYCMSACLCMLSVILLNPSVCPSHYGICIEMSARIVKLFTPSGRGITNFFECYCRCKIPVGTPSVVGLNTWWWEAIFDRNHHLSHKRYEIGPWLLWITNRN